MEMSPLDYDPFSDDFGDYGDKTLSNKMVIARKIHKCFNCMGDIQKGEKHRNMVDVIDGEIYSYRWCAKCCNAMMDDMMDKSGWGSRYYKRNNSGHKERIAQPGNYGMD